MLYAFTYDQFVIMILIGLAIMVLIPVYMLIIRDPSRQEKLYGYRKFKIKKRRK